MSKKVLSLTLALALLLSALSCGFVMAGAETVAPEATAKDGYSIQTVADKDTIYADWLTQVMSQSNGLNGLRPSIYSAIDANGGMSGDPASAYHTYCPNANAQYLYDGLVPGINATIDNNTTTNKKIFWETNKYPYLFIDLGGQIQLKQLLLAAAVGEGNFGTVSIYAGTDAATLVTDANLVAQESSFFSAVITLDDIINAQYVAVHFTGSMARVSELGVYAYVPYTVQKFADKATDSADYLNTVMSRTNLLKSASYALYTAADFSTSANFGNGSSVTALTDGNISGTTDSATSSSKVYWGNAATSYLFYDFGGTATIDQLLMASSTTEKNQSIKIYAGNDKATLLNAENLIVDETDLFTGVFTLKAAVTVRYLAFNIVGSSNYARVSELAAYSDLPIVMPPTINDMGDYTETVITLPSQVDVLADVLARPNLVTGLTPKTYADTDFVNGTAGSVGGTVSYMSDGNIPGISDDNTTNGNYKVFWNSTNNPYLYFDLGGKATIDQLLLAGSYPEYLQYGNVLGAVKIYLGNDPATLVSEDNLVAESTVSVTSLYTLDTAVEARYIAVWFGGDGNYARVSELGVYSTSLLAEDKDGYTIETFNSTDYADYLATVMTQENLAKPVIPAVYAENGTKGTLNDNTGSNYMYLTDGSVAGLTDDNNSNYKVHWNSATSRYMYLDLGKCADIEQLLIAGSYPEYLGWNTTLGQVKIYAAGDKVGLVSEDNLIADETLKVGAIITPDEAVSARYIAIWFGASYGRVSELGIYGEYQNTQSLGAGVRDRNADGTYGLRFAFSIEAVGIDYAAEDAYVRQELSESSLMVIDGVERQVLDFGTIISKDAVAADQLVQEKCNDSTIKKVPALNLYSVENNVVTFTAVVTNVPADYADDALCARPYVAYKAADGSTAYFYGEMITRSVDDVKEATGLS